MRSPFPDTGTILDLFRDLVGKTFTAKKLGDLCVDISRKTPAFVGTFCADNDDNPYAAVLFDHALAVIVAGSMVGVPENAIVQDLRRPEDAAYVKENLSEIMNIVCSLFNESGSLHLKFQNIVELIDPAKADPFALLRNPTGPKLHLELTLPPFKAGHLILARCNDDNAEAPAAKP